MIIILYLLYCGVIDRILALGMGQWEVNQWDWIMEISIHENSGPWDELRKSPKWTQKKLRIIFEKAQGKLTINLKQISEKGLGEFGISTGVGV